MKQTLKENDNLPDGLDQEEFLKRDKEWHGLERRIGQPRVMNHPYISDILPWVKKKFAGSMDKFSYFEAGVGHGNDFRAFREALGGAGHYLGVDLSQAEIETGLKYYHDKHGEDADLARSWFALGDLRSLGKIRGWDKARKSFTRQIKIDDNTFNLVYMEAVIHGLGYGFKTYHEKKESAQKMLNELYRIMKKSGKFFGRVSVFDNKLPRDKEFEILRQYNNWRFVPEVEEFKEMLESAGFKIIKTETIPHENSSRFDAKKHILHMAFIVER